MTITLVVKSFISQTDCSTVPCEVGAVRCSQWIVADVVNRSEVEQEDLSASRRRHSSSSTPL